MNTSPPSENRQGEPIGSTATRPAATQPATQNWGNTKTRITDTASRMSAVHLQPEWIDVRRANLMFSLCKSTIYRLADEGKIRTVSLRDRNKLRGKRLFSTASIQALLESRATGGEAVEP